MLRCPLSSVSSNRGSFGLLRFSLCRVGGDKGGVRADVRGAVGEGLTLGTGEGLMGVNLWAPGWGRLLRCRRLAPGPRRGLGADVVLVRSRRGSVVGGGRGSPVSALRVGSCHGWRGRVVFKHHGLFSHFTVTERSVREPEEHNRKLLITNCAAAGQRRLSSAALSNNTLCTVAQAPLVPPAATMIMPA